jgi:hypothetical protein
MAMRRPASGRPGTGERAVRSFQNRGGAFGVVPGGARGSGIGSAPGLGVIRASVGEMLIHSLHDPSGT